MPEKARHEAEKFRLIKAVLNNAKENGRESTDYDICEALLKLNRLDKAMAREMENYCNIPDYDGSKKEASIKMRTGAIIHKFIGCEYEWTDNLYSPLALKLKGYSNFIEDLTHINL